jgi:hypothetical protein
MSQRMAYAIDDSRWPLLIARATEYLSDESAADASYRKLEQILTREELFVLVFDMRGATSTSARRKRFREWGQRHEAALTRLLVAAAIVARSSIEHGFVTASLWLAAPVFPMRVFTDPVDAESWLLTDFAERLKQRRP